MITDRERTILQRRALGETQLQVARALRISQSVVSRVEQRIYEKYLDAHDVLRTLDELGVDVTPRKRHAATSRRKR